MGIVSDHYKEEKSKEDTGIFTNHLVYDDDDPYVSHTFDHWLRDLNDYKNVKM